MTLLAAVTITLLVGGVVATVVPRVPGGPVLSVAGVVTYWWGTGYTEPSTGVVVLLVLLCTVSIAGSLVGPVLASRIGGTPTLTTAVAGAVGAVAFFFWGTSGLILGVFGTVFVLEYLRRGNLVASATSSIVVVLVTFASKVTKVLVTVGVLFVMGAVIVL